MRGFRPRPQIPAPERTPAGTRAYTELRRRILHGALAPGTVLSEADTAALLGVSRTPLREAIRELLNEGLCDDGPRRQAIVAVPSPDINREVALLRSHLERLAVREAASRRQESDIDALHLIMIRTRRALTATDRNAYLDCDDDFHLEIARVAGPYIILEAVRRMRGLTRLAGIADHATEADLLRSADEHEAIIAALDAGDPDQAEQAMADHLITATKTLTKVVD